EHEYGKTEMWYVMDCDPGSFLYFGVKQSLSAQDFKERLENNTVLEVLNRVEVHQGDVFFIESGTIHAIGAGIMICEIQQNSNTTYRVYDYDRRGVDGKPRELHVEKALAVSKFIPSDTIDHQGAASRVGDGTVTPLASCKYFTSDKWELTGETSFTVQADSFASLVVLAGSGTLTGIENTVEFQSGDSIFIPANSGEMRLCGNCTLIKTTI
ncbi:MAG: class I mannose-6-phosphate isomerase, partial [Oscillospiraceae bacterium]